MVHLATVVNDKARRQSVLPELEGLKRLSIGTEHDSANATVYGSSYAGEVRRFRQPMPL